MDVVVQIAFTPDGLPDAGKDVLAGCCQIAFTPDGLPDAGKDVLAGCC
jgi:hypothetical protein